ncbi:hypothetical protein BHM03_00030682, partial [Ensete ventricosum]
KNKKEGKKEYLARLPSSPAVAYVPSPPTGRLQAVAARGRGRFFFRARRQSVSPCGETDRGDKETPCTALKLAFIEHALYIPPWYGSHTGTDSMSVHRYGPDVKVGDFGVARFQNQEGVMTAETGTYRWMAPEVGLFCL